MSSADSPDAFGRRGLMLGDILGSKAGETCTELVDLFLPVRGAMEIVFRAEGPEEPG